MDGEDGTVVLAREVDAALVQARSADAVCDLLRSTDCPPREVFAEMIRAWRIFSPDFRAACSDQNRRFLYELTESVPKIIQYNYRQQVRGFRQIAARRRASMTRGRVDICIDAPFSDGARHEVHDIFSRKDGVAGWANALALLPNLGVNDIASTIWAGRIYQDDFFRAAPERLKLTMLEHLHAVNAIIAQPFVAQILADRTLPRRYRVLAWAEGVLRPHDYCNRRNALIRQAYASATEERHPKDSARRLKRIAADCTDQAIEIGDWLSAYSGGDNPARFDMERSLRGYKLSWQIVQWLASHSAQHILEYYITERTDELSAFFPLGEFAAYLCGNGKCQCAIPLLQAIEGVSPGILSGYLGDNGANLLEHLLYRHEDDEPERGGWLRMCFERTSDIHPLAEYLMCAGCEDDAPNGVGITWADIRDAAKERFDGSVFRRILTEDSDEREYYSGIEDLIRATSPFMDKADIEDRLPNDQQD